MGGIWYNSKVVFTHLHVHTEYSLLDGMCHIQDLLLKAKEMGMDSLAVTDHGSMYGAVEFYAEARDLGVKPIIGCEVYMTPSQRKTKLEKNAHHLVLLVRDRKGYQNLTQLVTKAYLEGFYYKPRVDKEILREYHGGLVALSGCLQGEIPQLLLQDRMDEAKAAALWYKEVFGDFYLEIQRHSLPEEEKLNPLLISLAHELDLPLVATNDVHYVEKADVKAHDILLCIQTNRKLSDRNRLRMGDSFYFKSGEEMENLFSDLPQAVENTKHVAELCNLELEFGHFHLPEVTSEGKDAHGLLSELCFARLRERYPQPSPEVRERLEYELEVIQKTEFANYFLVVWDIISFAEREGISFGVRGSAASSLVLYILGITNTDPLKYGLVFERFLNVERKEMPDIDIDFQDDRRDEVIHYVTRKYGEDHVAQIITFGTMGARAAVRDVGRVMGIPLPKVDRVAKLIPPVGLTLEEAVRDIGELHSLHNSDESMKELFDFAQRLEGTVRHASTHAAGIVISREPLTTFSPLQKGKEGKVMTQFSMESIARIGLLKLDLLGLANLTILAHTRELIRENRGEEIDLQAIPLDDSKTFDLLSSGETGGIFQLEGEGMRKYIRKLSPSSFSDIAAMIALYRPGPKDYIPHFIAAKKGEEAISYPHPSLADILGETYGVIVYQEQVLHIAQEFAGYTLGEADLFRKAIGKKIPKLMEEERERFIQGAKEKGFSSDVAKGVFDLIEPFAGYAFNKSHSVSYALIAYQGAFFKANYSLEYMTALLQVSGDNQDKVRSAIAECHRLGIDVLPPNINQSDINFKILGRSILYGLGAVKNIGEAALSSLISCRKTGGPFSSIEDLCRRVDFRGINRKVVESLIKAGALDDLGKRGALLKHIDSIILLAQRERKRKDSGQTTMFDLCEDLPSLEMGNEDVPLEDKVAWEGELLGVSFSEVEGKNLIISLTQGENEERDLDFLQHIVQVLHRYPGQSKVYLDIREDGNKRSLVEMAELVDPCPDFTHDLAELVDGVKVLDEMP
jgi:DNA polymerase-3 subunit alpha